MDLLESGDERSPLRVRAAARVPVRAVPPVLALLAALVLVAGGASVGPVADRLDRERTRVDVGLSLVDARSSTVRGVARGELVLRLENRRDVPVRLEGLVVVAEGLRVDGVAPPTGELPAGASLQVVVRFLVPSCADLRLPGVVDASLSSGGGPVRTVVVPLVAADAEDPPPGAAAARGVPVRVRARDRHGRRRAGRRGAVRARADRRVRDRAGRGAQRRRGRAAAGARASTCPAPAWCRGCWTAGARSRPTRWWCCGCASRCRTARRWGSPAGCCCAVERAGEEQEVAVPLGRDGSGPAVELPVLLDACGGVGSG